MLAALRMALFQLRILSRIPHHAAVDTAVTLAQESTGNAARFVNGILRNALRKPVALPVRDRDEVAYLAVNHSHPRWLVEGRWTQIVRATRAPRR